jgi:AraC-like DNA-binding protein
MIMRPLEAHHLVVCSDKVPYERIVANIHPELLKYIDPQEQILSHLFSRPLGTLNRFDASLFSHTLCSDAMTMIALQSHDMSRLDLLSRIMLVLSEANRATKRLNPDLREENVGDRLINYVNQNLFKNISLQQISEIFFLSQSQINRIFKKNTGSSIGQYIAAKRLLTARNRIRAGEPAVKVSEECGYRDYSAFYRSYCAKFGCTPQEDKKA